MNKMKLKKTLKVLMIIYTIAPFVVWGGVNIDLKVLFDHSPNMFWIHLPSTAQIDEINEMVIEVWDEFERISTSYKGQINFNLISYNLTDYQTISASSVVSNIPTSYTFAKVNFGVERLSFSISTQGIHYILATNTLTGKTFWSNPILVDYNPIKLIWGDVHSHSIFCDGGGLPRELYNYARYIALLDFCSVTSHGEFLHLNGGFNALEQATNRANDPGKFITSQGVEWTSGTAPHVPLIGWGHFTSIFSGTKLAHLSSSIQKNPSELWSELDRFTSEFGCRAIALPHHTVSEKYIQDWPVCFDYSQYVRLGEVFSVHGSSLVNPYSEWNVTGEIDQPSYQIQGSSINEALMMGLRLGLVANGDSHDGFPGHSLSHTRAFIGHQYPPTYILSRVSHLYPSGLTGAFVSDITRDNIFDALYDRRVLANSDFGRPYVTFKINDVEVGEDDSTVFVANSTSLRELKLFIAQDGTPPAAYLQAAQPWNGNPNWNAKVQIFKNGYLWKEELINAPVTQLFFYDNETIVGASYNNCIEKEGEFYINEKSHTPVNPSSLNTNGVDYYFIRILCSRGRVTAIGPLWVESLT